MLYGILQICQTCPHSAFLKSIYRGAAEGEGGITDIIKKGPKAAPPPNWGRNGDRFHIRARQGLGFWAHTTYGGFRGYRGWD